MTANDRDTTALRLLDAAIHSLRADLLPLLSEDVARMRLDHVTRLLRLAQSRLTLREASLRTLLRAGGTPGSEASNLAALERARETLESEVADALPALLDGAATGDAQALARLDALIAQQKELFVAHDPDILRGSIVAYRGGRIDEPPPPRSEPWPQVTEESLTAYLRRHFQRDALRAEGVRAIPGGFSKETLFFTKVDAAANTRQDCVLRKDLPLPFLDLTVTDEFALLAALHGRGFPVARPLWLEADAGALGAPFLVSERVGGSSNVAQWAADPARATKACRELARVLARLHAVPPAELGFPAARAQQSAGAMMQAQIERWTRLFDARRREAHPLQRMPLLWLARNIPPALFERPARVVHGDFGFHNMMFDERGAVTALLDWEFSGLGDPTQDLCFVRLFVEPLMKWDEFLALYLELGGIAPCAEADFFFDLFTKTRNSVGCVAGMRLFDTVLPHETKFGMVGHVFAPYLWLEECEAVAARLKRANK